MEINKLPILLWESSNPTSDKHLKRLKKYFNVIKNRNLIKHKEKENVIGIATHTSPTKFYDYRFFEEFINLKFVASPTTGNTHFDMKKLENNGIKVFLIKNRKVLQDITSSSEHALFLMLSVFRNSKKVYKLTEDGSWRKKEKEFRANQISGKKVGIIGFGRIGRNVANSLKTLRAKIYINDIKEFDCEFTQISLEEMFRISDAILISCTYDKSSHHLIKKKLMSLSKELFLINIARGEIINERDLIEAINYGNVRRYYADVISSEQLGCEKNILWKASQTNNNINLTPHSAGLSYESEDLAASDIVNQIESFIKK